MTKNKISLIYTAATHLQIKLHIQQNNIVYIS